MSKERKLLLSDEDAIRIGVAAGGDKFVTLKTIALGVRDYYERLIDEGKLRVVDEVEAVMDSDRSCSRCGHYTSDGFTQWNFCPGCGNKIKRDGDR